MTLAPRTTVRMLAFGPQGRTVALDGEAFFDVPHANRAPFIVQTGRVSTRVMGTAFDVHHYHGESRCSRRGQNGEGLSAGAGSATL